MGILLKEHVAYTLSLTDDRDVAARDSASYLLRQPGKKIEPRVFKIERGQKEFCFDCHVSDTSVELYSGYFVGIDWLCDGRYIQIEPKLNTAVGISFDRASVLAAEGSGDAAIESLDNEALENIQKAETNIEVDIVAMLMELMSHPEVAKHTDKLLLIDWDAPEIPVNQKQDWLTPFLVVRFLKLLHDITRRGLKKSYYKVQENLRNRIKGKILVGQQIKQNVLRNRFANTICEYQVFGEDALENRFLKKVFQFCTQYVENNTQYFKSKDAVIGIINYIRPLMEGISTDIDMEKIKSLRCNPFFEAYKEAIKTGQQILKRFSYNLTKVTSEQVFTPPFWIDMPKMFELYVFVKFLKDNPHLTASHFNYQFSTYGNVLDFLICAGDQKIVVDAKYKLRYSYGHIHQDIRQVAGYARLEKVRTKLGSEEGKSIDCLIIYPDMNTDQCFKYSLDNIRLACKKITAYDKVYKLGIPLPRIMP